eukprot:2100000-Rhodomonas_salina.4
MCYALRLLDRLVTENKSFWTKRGARKRIRVVRLSFARAGKSRETEAGKHPAAFALFATCADESILASDLPDAKWGFGIMSVKKLKTLIRFASD